MSLLTRLHILHSALQSERPRLALWLPVPLMLGIWVYFMLDAEPPVWAGGAILAGCAGLLALAWRHALRLAAVILLLMAMGFAAAQWRAHSVATPLLADAMHSEVEATIEGIEPVEQKVKLVLAQPQIEDVPPGETPRRLRVAVRDHGESWQVGDRVRLYAALYPLPAPDMPGAYDFARHFYFRGIGSIGYTLGTPEVIGHGQGGFSEWLGNLRHHIGEDMRAHMQGAVGTVAAAMTVGETGPIPEDVKTALRDAGLAHMLAIAGLHLGIVTGIIFFTVRLLLTLWPAFALRAPVKKIAACFGLIGAFIYLMLAGGPVPAQRAFIMVSVLFLAVLLDRRGVTLRTLSMAAAIILLLFPEAMFGASFQLSFAATLAIVSLYESIRRRPVVAGGAWPWWHHVRRHVLDIVFTSLAATLATAPFVLYNFNRFAIFGMLANMLVIPLATFVIMPGMLLALLLMPIGWQGIGYAPMGYGTGVMIAMAQWVTGLPHSSIRLPSPTDGGLALASFGLLWLCLMTQKWRWLGLGFIFAGLATIALHRPYDVMISNDGRKVAWRMDDGRFLFVRGRPDSFDAEVWLRYHGQEEGLALHDLDDAQRPECNEVFCTVKTHEKHMIIGRRREMTEGMCDGKPDIVISENMLDDAACAQVPLLIDQRFLHAHGALGLRFREGRIEMGEAGDGHGKRLWNMPQHPSITGEDSSEERP